MREKLRDARGETLVEVLASVLICALSITLLFGAVMASGNIDLMAQKADEEYYGALSKAERQDPDNPAEDVSGIAVQVEETTPLDPGEAAPPFKPDPLRLDCTFYGTKRLFSYATAEELPPAPDPVPGPGGGP
nr:hypothetical protein [uncultured Oscillibacter sp.]